MNSSGLASGVLIPHPTTTSPVVSGVTASVRRPNSRSLTFHFVLACEIDRLRVPTPCPSRRMDGLWRHTCFEAFIAHAGESTYYEFNFAPSGEWAAYAFRAYREGGPLALNSDPVIRARRFDHRLELDAVVPLDWLGEIGSRASFRLALATVVEDGAGALSYWALAHPPGRPDFHHPAAFVLPLEWPPDDLAATTV